MFKILYQLDDLDNIEANLVAEAANRLGVGEFQFFQLAYYAWYGDDIEPKRMEDEFFGYMVQDKVPPWVRQYARNIIKQDDAHEMDPTDSSYHRYDLGTPPPSYSFSGISKVAAVLLFTLLFMGGLIVTYEMNYNMSQRCFFPPCYLADELRAPPVP